MWRVRNTFVIRYGHYNDVLDASQKLNELTRQRGWTESTFWVGLTGVDNFFVVETDFDTLEAYERESKATSRDEEWMKLIRSNIDYIVEGSSETEIFQTAERIA
jgi:hypothetical protein